MKKLAEKMQVMTIEKMRMTVFKSAATLIYSRVEQNKISKIGAIKTHFLGTLLVSDKRLSKMATSAPRDAKLPTPFQSGVPSMTPVFLSNSCAQVVPVHISEIKK